MKAPTLAGDGLRLEPLTLDDVGPMHALGDDPDVLRFTYVSAPFEVDDARAWVQRYVDGWVDGTRAGFRITADDGAFLGMVAIVDLQAEARQGDIGYIVAPAARGRGTATAALRLIAEWALGPLGLERVELRIDTENAGSIAVAERAGFRYEGTLRSLAFKDGLRADIRVFSRLPGDPAP